MDQRLDSRMPGISPPAWPAVLGMISEIDEMKGWWKGRYSPPPSYLAGLRKRTIAVSARASIGIDWVGIPRAGEDPVASLPPARAEVQRNASAARYSRLLKSVFDGRERPPLDRETIFGLHAGLLGIARNGLDAASGYRALPDRSAYLPRRSFESIALRPADPAAIPGAMDALLRWTNSRLGSAGYNPLLVIACFVLEFLAIRPFSAANGRTSRLLTGLLLMNAGYTYIPYASLEKVIAERKAEYYLALRKSQSSLHLPRPDMGPWFLAFLGAMRAQARELKCAMAPMPAEGRLSENQLGALALLDRHREITNRLVATELGLPRDTAKQVLNRLVALNLLSRAGAGRAVRYRKPDPA